VRYVVLESESVEENSGRFLERMRSVLADIEVSSANTELCECKKTSVINKEAIITKNKVISINQLNYKAPHKSHATQELVGYKEQRGTFWSLHLGHFVEGHTIQSTFFVTVHKCAHIIECYY
jgi:hypothetical protein